MRIHIFRVLWLALLLSPTAALAGPDRVAEVLEQQRTQGFHSSLGAIADLQAAAAETGPGATADVRRRFHAALVEFAVAANRLDMAETSVAALERLAGAPGCRACAMQAHLSRARLLLERQETAAARRELDAAASLLPPDDPASRLALEYVSTRVLYREANLPQAMRAAMDGARIADTLGNATDRLRLLLMMVRINGELDYLEPALQVSGEAIRLGEAIGATELVATAQLNLGFLHGSLGNREQQRRSLTAAVERVSGDPTLAVVEVLARANLADYYLHTGDLEAVLHHSRKAVAVGRRSGEPKGLAIALTNEGIAQAGLGRVDAGVASLHEAIGLVERIGHKRHIVGITRELVKVLQAAGRYREALEKLGSIAELEREITRMDRERALMELQAEYDNERKSREIARLEAENRAKAAEVAARTWRQRLWATVAVGLALAAALLVQWLMRSRRLNRDLSVVNASLAEESSHDPLTGACNRRHFEQQMAQLARSGTSVGLMVLDLDRFKQVNDRHGHEAGDAVLVEVARRLRGLLRGQDTVVHWGGEEFVLVLPGTTAEGMARLAGRVLRVIGGEPVRHRNQALALTVSGGCVAHPLAPGKDWEEAFRLADAGLYLAKQSGRNRAVCVISVDPAAGAAPVGDLLAAQRDGTAVLETINGPVVAAAAAAPEAIA